MPREYAKNWFSMWTDDDFCNQPRFDKLLYQVLLGQPPTMLNYAGVQTINFKRWRKAMRDGDQLPTELEMKAALVRMERRRNVYTDDETGEMLIRSFIRRDEVYKQPNVMLSALRAAAIVESPKLCAVLLDELKNRVSLPEIKGRKDEKAAQRLRGDLAQAYETALRHLETVSEGFPEDLPEPFSEDFPEGFSEGLPRPGKTEPSPEPFREGIGEGSVVVEVEVPTSPPVGGYVGERARETETADTPPVEPRNDPPAAPPTDGDDDPEPPRRCKTHRALPADAEIPNCPHCGHFRAAHTKWQIRERHRRNAADSEAAQAHAALITEAIHACGLCDEDGYRNGSVCDHDPNRADTNARGMAAVRQALRRTPEPTDHDEPEDQTDA
jgi:hypothetical protein